MVILFATLAVASGARLLIRATAFRQVLNTETKGPVAEVLVIGLLMTLGGLGLLSYEFISTPTVPSSDFGTYSVGYSQGTIPTILNFNVGPSTNDIYLQLGFSSLGVPNSRFFIILPYQITSLNAPGDSISNVNVPGYGSILYGNETSDMQIDVRVSGIATYDNKGTLVFVMPVGNGVSTAMSGAKENIQFLNGVPFTNNFNITMELYLPKYAQIQQTFPQLSNFEFFNSTVPGGAADQVLIWNDVRTPQSSVVELSATYTIPSEEELAAIPDLLAGILLGVGIPLLIPEVAKTRASKNAGGHGNGGQGKP